MTHDEALELHAQLLKLDEDWLSVVGVRLDDDGYAYVICEDERGELAVESMDDVDNRADRPETLKEQTEAANAAAAKADARLDDLAKKKTRTAAERDELLTLVARKLL